jgi:hypothetical protein
MRGQSLSPGRVKNSPFSMSSRLAPGPTQWVPAGGLSPGVKWWGHEADHSPPTSAEIKKHSLYTHFLVCLHGTVLNN